MINFWLKGDFEDLKKMPLKDRLVMGMMSGLVDVYFAQEVIDIIVARYPQFSFTDNATTASELVTKFGWRKESTNEKPGKM